MENIIIVPPLHDILEKGSTLAGKCTTVNGSNSEKFL
jgi:hypothetical protein